jgi:hypothetical protein
MVREALVKRSSDESSADHQRFSPRP